MSQSYTTISSTADDGWLAGQSDTASKPRRQLSNPRDSAARPGGYCTAARHRAITEDEVALDASLLGRSRFRCRCRTPAGLARVQVPKGTAVVLTFGNKVSIVRWPTEDTVADCRPDGLSVFGPRAFIVERRQLVQW